MLCFLAVGVPYWFIPYNRISLPDTLVSPALGLLTICAFLLVYNGPAPLWRTTWTVAASVPAAVLARVLVDAVIDSTSHNLWPFELIIAAIIGLLAAAAGSLPAWLFSRLRPGSRGTSA